MDITQHDARNLLLLLNRVETTGIDEAKVLAVLASKLEKALQAPTEDTDGEDAPTTAE